VQHAGVADRPGCLDPGELVQVGEQRAPCHWFADVLVDHRGAAPRVEPRRRAIVGDARRQPVEHADRSSGIRVGLACRSGGDGIEEVHGEFCHGHHTRRSAAAPRANCLQSVHALWSIRPFMTSMLDEASTLWKHTPESTQ
jgi:hypothetical protein